MQMYGFSPEWLRIWYLRRVDRMYCFPQTLQTCGRSPVCRKRMCVTRTLACMKPSPQTPHMCCLTPICNFLCSEKLRTLLKHLPHELHMYCFGSLAHCVDWLSPTMCFATCRLRCCL